MPKGYWILSVTVHDQPRYDAYRAENIEALRKFGGRFLVRGGTFENPERGGPALLRSDAALDASRSAAKLANEALDLANQAYRAGATTNLEVIDAERAASDADTSAAVAEDTARQARLDMLSASGRFP